MTTIFSSVAAGTLLGDETNPGPSSARCRRPGRDRPTDHFLRGNGSRHEAAADHAPRRRRHRRPVAGGARAVPAGPSSNDVNESWATEFQKAGRDVHAGRAAAVLRRHQLRLRRHRRLRRPVLLPGRPDRLSRPRLHAGPRPEPRRARRLRQGVRRRARGRPPRPEPARRHRQRRPARLELVRRGRAAGRLPGRRLGQQRQAARADRERRPGRGSERRGVGRR